MNVGTLAMNECRGCHGLWLDARTVAKLERDADARATFTVTQSTFAGAPGNSHQNVRGNTSPIRYRRCPICADVMSRVNVARISGVIVDRCQEHGTYFDIDELQQLVQFLENGGVDRARTREREALADERRHLQFMKELEQKQMRFEASPRSEAPSFTASALLSALAHKLLDG